MTGGHGHVIPRPDGAKARCGGPALCSVCAIELAQVQRERTAAGVLLSLAAEFDRLAAETSAEVAAHEANNDDDVACMAYGARDAWQSAAARARAHARSVRREGNEAAPVSREGQEPAADPEAPQRVALGMLVRAVWVAWAREQPDARPSWLAGWAELDAGQREVDMRIGEAVAEAERERIRQQIDPAQLDKLADWFDTDDEFKVAMFPGTWPERGHEVQEDLRRWARVIRGGTRG